MYTFVFTQILITYLSEDKGLMLQTSSAHWLLWHFIIPTVINFQLMHQCFLSPLRDHVIGANESKDFLFVCLQASRDESILDAAAIQFCARKVAATTGDMRKALDICRLVCQWIFGSVITGIASFKSNVFNRVYNIPVTF